MAASDIYGFLVKNKLTTKSAEDFEKSMQDTTKQRELYDFFALNKLTTKDKATFQTEHFGELMPAVEADMPLDTAEAPGAQLEETQPEGVPIDSVPSESTMTASPELPSETSTLSDDPDVVVPMLWEKGFGEGGSYEDLYLDYVKKPGLYKAKLRGEGFVGQTAAALGDVTTIFPRASAALASDDPTAAMGKQKGTGFWSNLYKDPALVPSIGLASLTGGGSMWPNIARAAGLGAGEATTSQYIKDVTGQEAPTPEDYLVSGSLGLLAGGAGEMLGSGIASALNTRTPKPFEASRGQMRKQDILPVTGATDVEKAKLKHYGRQDLPADVGKAAEASELLGIPAEELPLGIAYGGKSKPALDQIAAASSGTNPTQTEALTKAWDSGNSLVRGVTNWEDAMTEEVAGKVLSDVYTKAKSNMFEQHAVRYNALAGDPETAALIGENIDIPGAARMINTLNRTAKDLMKDATAKTGADGSLKLDLRNAASQTKEAAEGLQEAYIQYYQGELPPAEFFSQLNYIRDNTRRSLTTLEKNPDIVKETSIPLKQMRERYKQVSRLIMDGVKKADPELHKQLEVSNKAIAEFAEDKSGFAQAMNKKVAKDRASAVFSKSEHVLKLDKILRQYGMGTEANRLRDAWAKSQVIKEFGGTGTPEYTLAPKPSLKKLREKQEVFRELYGPVNLSKVAKTLGYLDAMGDPNKYNLGARLQAGSGAGARTWKGKAAAATGATFAYPFKRGGEMLNPGRILRTTDIDPEALKLNTKINLLSQRQAGREGLQGSAQTKTGAVGKSVLRNLSDLAKQTPYQTGQAGRKAYEQGRAKRKEAEDRWRFR